MKQFRIKYQSRTKVFGMLGDFEAQRTIDIDSAESIEGMINTIMQVIKSGWFNFEINFNINDPAVWSEKNLGRITNDYNGGTPVLRLIQFDGINVEYECVEVSKRNVRKFVTTIIKRYMED